jgi:hypothetical protein
MSEFQIGHFKYSITPVELENFYKFGNCLFTLPVLDKLFGVQLIILSLVDPSKNEWTIEFADVFENEKLAETFAHFIIENLMSNEMLVEEEEL